MRLSISKAVKWEISGAGRPNASQPKVVGSAPVIRNNRKWMDWWLLMCAIIKTALFLHGSHSFLLSCGWCMKMEFRDHHLWKFGKNLKAMYKSNIRKIGCHFCEIPASCLYSLAETVTNKTRLIRHFHFKIHRSFIIKHFFFFNRERTMTLHFCMQPSHRKGRQNSTIGKKVNSFIFFFTDIIIHNTIVERKEIPVCFPKCEAWPSQSNKWNISQHIHYYIKLYKINLFFFLLMTTEKEFWYSPIA